MNVVVMALKVQVVEMESEDQMAHKETLVQQVEEVEDLMALKEIVDRLEMLVVS